MASNLNDSFYDIENIDVSKVISIQANIRGHLVRKRLKCLRDVYLEIVESLETSKQPCVQWSKHAPCYPRFTKQRKYSLANQGIDNETPRGTSNRQFSTAVTGDSDGEKKMVSVEIQTSVVSDSGGESTEEKTEVNRLESGGPSPRPLGEDDKSPRPLCENDKSPNPLCENDTRLTSREQSPLTVGEGYERLSAETDRMPPGGDEVQPTPEKQEVEETKEERGEQNTGVSDTSSFTDVTSLWESQVAESRHKPDEVKDINSSSILEVRKNLAMELLWVQQAINSRKHYLSLKAQME